MALALASASLTFCSTMLGGLTALRWPSRTDVLMALAGGVVLAAALFDLLPEGVERAQDLGMSVRIPIGAVLAGFLTFHVVERLVHRHGDDHHHDRPDPVGIAGATGKTSSGIGARVAISAPRSGASASARRNRRERVAGCRWAIR